MKIILETLANIIYDMYNINIMANNNRWILKKSVFKRYMYNIKIKVHSFKKETKKIYLNHNFFNASKLVRKEICFGPPRDGSMLI